MVDAYQLFILIVYTAYSFVGEDWALQAVFFSAETNVLQIRTYKRKPCDMYARFYMSEFVLVL